MYPKLLIIALLFSTLVVLPIWRATQPVQAAPNPQQEGVVAFVNVNVIPMDSERVLENQTVIVEGDRIATIGPNAEVTVPEGAQIVEGNGTYLMPGLADMHTHLQSIVPAFEGPGQLPLFLAQGVTTIRNYSGLPENLTWRDEVARGERVGPTIYTAGPLIIGVFDPSLHMRFWATVVLAPVLLGIVIWLLIWGGLRWTGRGAQFRPIRRYALPSLALLLVMGGLAAWLKVIPLASPAPYAVFPETADRARQAVRAQKAAGYDFVKVYDFLSPEAYLATINEANQQGIYVVGHLLDELPVATSIAGGLQEAAHVDEFMEEHMLGEASPQTGFNEVAFNYETIPQTAATVKAHDAMVVANLVTDEVVYQNLFDPEAGLAQPEYDIVAPEVLNAWLTQGRYVDWQGQQTWRRDVQFPFLKAMAKALYDAGVPLLIGTDLTVEGMVPAHIHRDLELLVEAGLTPYAALEAGTKNAGIAVDRMGRDGNFGTVAAGQRADLVLLAQNPLENISHTRNRVGVMARGHWYTQAELDEMINAYVAAY